MTHLFVTDIVDEIFISNHFSKRLYQIRITIIKDWITNRRCTESSHKPSKIYRMVIKTANTDSLFRSIPVVIKRTDKMTAVTLRDSINSNSGMYNTLLTSIIGISIFIIMFSLISLINTLVTNIMTRKQELSVLQSIGMTKRQLNRMVQCEAGLIAAWNIIITFLAGGFLGFMLIRGLNSIGMSYLHWAYPIGFALFYAVIVLIMPAIITKATINLLQKKSIVERLREIE